MLYDLPKNWFVSMSGSSFDKHAIMPLVDHYQEAVGRHCRTRGWENPLPVDQLENGVFFFVQGQCGTHRTVGSLRLAEKLNGWYQTWAFFPNFSGALSIALSFYSPKVVGTPSDGSYSV